MLDIDAEIKNALKSKNTTALAAYRALKTKVMVKLTEAGRESGKPLTEEELIACAKREIKERAESNEFLPEGDPKRVENNGIVAVLEKHLPAQLSPEAMEAAIQDVFARLSPQGPQDMGKVMGALRGVEGLDMGAASARVKALLAAKA